MLGYSFSSERSERAMPKRASQSNSLARRHIEIIAPARRAGSFYRILSEQSLHVINCFTQRVIVRRSTVQREYQYR